MPPPPATVSDFTPYVQSIMTSNGGKQPDVVFLVVAPSNVYGLGPALSQAGFTGVDTNAVAYVPRSRASPRAGRRSPSSPRRSRTSSEMAEINANLKAAGIDDPWVSPVSPATSRPTCSSRS